MAGLLGPIESAAFCTMMGFVPPSEGSVNCGGNAFTIQGVTYLVNLPSPDAMAILSKGWVGLPDAPGPDVNYDAGSWDASGSYTSPRGFTNRQQEIAARSVPSFLFGGGGHGNYALKLLGARAAALLTVNEVEGIRTELGLGSLKETLDLLYAHGWRDVGGWTTAIGRPLAGFAIDGDTVEVDEFWLAWYYALLTLGSAFNWNGAVASDLKAAEAWPYSPIPEYPLLTDFQNWRASNSLLVRAPEDVPQGQTWHFKIVVDDELDPLLRSTSLADVASVYYRMFATLGKALTSIRNERAAKPGNKGIGGLFGKIRGIGHGASGSGGGVFLDPSQLPSDVFGPGKGGHKGGRKFSPASVFDGGGTSPGRTPGGKTGTDTTTGTGGTDAAAAKSWPFWKKAAVALGGAAVVGGGVVLAVRARKAKP